MDLIVGRCGYPRQDGIGILVANLDALQVEDGQAAQAGELARKSRVDDRIHRRRQDRDLEWQATKRLREVHVRRLDRDGTGRQRDVLESVGRSQLVDL